MRYILCENGYIEELVFGGIIECNGVECTEYTGAIPEGFESLEEWADTATIQAYKIVDGNLALDSAREAELVTKQAEEAEKNRLVTNSELEDALSGITIDEDSITLERSNSKEFANMLPQKISTDVVVHIENAGNFDIPSIKITPAKSLTGVFYLFVHNANLLINDSANANINGVEYIVNENRSIATKGRATALSAYTLAGSSDNKEPILTLKANENYYLNSLPAGVTLKLYYFDGVDRNLVASSNGGAIMLTSSKDITQAVLEIASGTTIDTTISPMLSLGTTTVEYEQAKIQAIPIDLGDTTVNTTDYLLITEGAVKLKGNNDICYIKQPYTYNGTNNIYVNASADITLKNLFELSADKISMSTCNYVIKDNSLTLTNEFVSYGGYLLMKIPVTPNTTYTISCVSTRTGTKGGGIEVYASNGTSNIADMVYKPNELNPVGTFTTTEYTTELWVYFLASGEEDTEYKTATFTNIQLEEGSVATPYEPYGSSLPTPSEVTYIKADLFDTVSGTGKLLLEDTFASTGAIGKAVFGNLAGGNIYTIYSSPTSEGQDKRYSVDLKGISGTCEVVIEKGEVKAVRNGEVVKTFDDIYLETFNRETYITVTGVTTATITIAYMLISTFAEYFCTRVEKNASITVLEDEIALEVTRATGVEEELSSRITANADEIVIKTEAVHNTLTKDLADEINRATQAENGLSSDISDETDRATKAEDDLASSIIASEERLSASITLTNNQITQEVSRATSKEEELSANITLTENQISQIVTAVGADGEVTASSIIQAINEDGSSIAISADKIDITGGEFPTLSNGLGNDDLAEITTLYTGSGKSAKGIKYTANYHEFYANQDFRIYAQDDITLETSGGSSSNDVRLSADGDIKLTASENVELTADYDIKLTADNEIWLTSTYDFTLQGDNIWIMAEDVAQLQGISETRIWSEDRINFNGKEIIWNGEDITGYFDAMANGTL